MNAPTTAIAVAEPKRSLLVEMASRYGMEAAAFAATLRATVVPRETSNEEFAAFLVVAREYNLNPLTKEIYAFPKRGGGIQPIVSVDGWCNLMVSHPQHNGLEFDDHLDKDGKLTAVTARIWRKDREKPTIVTEYMVECVRPTDTWKQYPRRMLRHKALIQCARYAYGFAGIVDPDEAERVGVDASRMKVVNGDGPPPPPPVAAPQIAHDPETGELPAERGDVVWTETGERPVTDDDTIPPALDRRNEHQPWLNDLSGALSGCEDFASLGEKQQHLMMPKKGKVPTEVWKKAEQMVRENLDRINNSNVLHAG